MSMQQAIQDLDAMTASLPTSFAAIPETDAALRPAPGKWSKKEVLGHLADSAFNNHRRFVIGQLQERFARIGYEQDGWVRVQGYQSRSWPEVISLWKELNLHLLHIWRSLPAAALQHATDSDDGPERTLAWLAEDYIRHLRHHLAKILPN